MKRNVKSDRSPCGLKSFVVRGEGLWPRVRDGEVIDVATRATPHAGDEVLVVTRDGLMLIREYLDCDESGVLTLRNIDGESVTTDLEDIDAIHVIAGIRQGSSRSKGSDNVSGSEITVETKQGRAFIG